MVEFEKIFVEHTDGRQSCSCCGRSIPKYIKRLSRGYTNTYGSICNIRICEACILGMSKLINKKNVEKWQQNLFAEAI